MNNTSLKESLNTRVRKEIVSKESLDFSNQVYFGEKGEFLKQKSYEISLISVKGALALGKIFEEVYQELGKDKNSNEGEGIYLEWLKTNNYSRVTAWRYRQKYNLYMKVDEKGKELVALLPFDLIALLSKEKDEYIDLLNKGITKEELKELLLQEQIKESSERKNELKKVDDFNFLEIGKVFNEKYSSLKEKDQIEVRKLLEKLEKILNI